VLSQRQDTILRFINTHVKTYGFPPSIREIAAVAGTSSTSVVSYNLDRLTQAGYLAKTPSKSRAHKLTPRALTYLGETDQLEPHNLYELLQEIQKLRLENQRLRREHLHVCDELRQLRDFCKLGLGIHEEAEYEEKQHA